MSISLSFCINKIYDPDLLEDATRIFRPFLSSQSDVDLLLGDANDATSRTTTGVTSLQGLFVATLAQIIRARVHHNGAADDALLPDELDVAVLDGTLGVALAVGLEVAQVADVAGAVGRCTVVLLERVDYREQDVNIRFI